MKSSTRVLVNTAIQYLRTVLTVIITLYTSRIIFDNLGENDYGIYTLVGGVVTMLSFISNSLSSTTQRYLSYNHGKGDKGLMIKVFNNSVVTQTVISVAFCFLLLILTGPVFNHFLNIAPERMEAARIVYYLMIATLFFNLQSTPYLATLIARENILYSTLVQILDAVLKIPIAISLIYISRDKLIWYSFCCALLIVLNYLCYYVYCKRHYDECRHFRFKSFDPSLFKEMFSFMGWMIYSTGCVVGRTQGIAIILNKFFTTAMNAAYGIGLQVSGQLSFLSNALTTAIRPQIIKAEGADNRTRTIRLSEMACKLSFLLMGIISIPAILHMDDLLGIWLVKVPEHAVMFCQYTLLAVWIDQLTFPLSIANAAIGNVRICSLWVNTIKLMTLPFVIVCLRMGFCVESVMITYVAFETICMLSRLAFLHINIRLDIIQFMSNVAIPMVMPTLLTILFCIYVSQFLQGFMFFFNFIFSFLLMSVLFLIFGLKEDEKTLFKSAFLRNKQQ